MTESVAIRGLPFELSWEGDPVQWSLAAGVLSITAGPETDLFVDPGSAERRASAPALVGPAPPGEWLFSARVSAELTATFDAGVLVLLGDGDTWAKLCLERSPDGEATIVSVVTRTVSDDCTSFAVAGPTAWLRIARRAEAFAFHASTDGERWTLIRHFRLDGASRLGFLAQSPTGRGCEARFDEIRLAPGRLEELRTGE